MMQFYVKIIGMNNFFEKFVNMNKLCWHDTISLRKKCIIMTQFQIYQNKIYQKKC